MASFLFLGAHHNGNSQVFVDALGTTTTYEAYLSSLFPGINFTVTTKADSKFKIVGAASVAAKVTRDACLDGWIFEEPFSDAGELWSTEPGSGYPSGATDCLLMLDLSHALTGQTRRQRVGSEIPLIRHLASPR